ncbi:MAG: serine/threonine-protein kinase [Kofleriaceae bacterium]
MLEPIGTGGFGTVYRARHSKTHREVALKVLHAERCTSDAMVDRFLDEVHTVNKLDLPGVIDIFDFGLEGTSHYLVMELLRGCSLATLLDRGPLPIPEALTLLRKIAVVVDALHAAGASHRDLKPANIMVLADGGVTLIDFGLAKLAHDVDRTVTRDAFGTPAYMAPEQCRGLGADARSDRYAFGVLAYRMLASRLPFEGEALSVALAHVDTTPRRPSRYRRLSPGIDAGILALLAKDPATRPTKLVPVVDELARRRVPARAIAVTASVLVLGSGGSYLAFRDTRPPPLDPANLKVVRTLDREVLNLMTMGADGESVEISGGDGLAVVRWSDGTERTVPGQSYRSWLTDRSFVDAGDGINLIDGTGKRTAIGTGLWPEACPRGGRIAFSYNDALYLIGLASGEEAKELTLAPASWGARWSPSCEVLVWTNFEGAHLTGIDGTTTLLPITLARPQDSYHAATFLDDNTIAYCGRRADGVAELRAHYLDNRSADTALLPLAAQTTGCSLASSVGGHRIAIVAHERQTTASIRDADGTHHEVGRDASGTGRVLGFTDEDHVLFATWPVESTYVTEPPKLTSPRRLEEVARDGTRRAFPACDGTIAATSYRGALALVSRESNAFVLRAPKTCALVTKLAFSPGASAPSCAGDVCVIARRDGHQLVAQQLAPVVRELARVPQEQTMRDVEPAPMIALSPDAAHLVMFRYQDPVAYMFELAGNPPPNEIRLGRSIDPRITTAVWEDDTHAVIATQYSSELRRVGIDRVSRRIDTAEFVFARSPSGKRLAIGTLTRDSHVVFAELEQ